MLLRSNPCSFRKGIEVRSLSLVEPENVGSCSVISAVILMMIDCSTDQRDLTSVRIPFPSRKMVPRLLPRDHEAIGGTWLAGHSRFHRNY